MTKDLKWLKEEVNEIKKLISDAWGASIIAGNQHFEKKNSNEMQVVKRISELIDQLDEPEVLTDEQIARKVDQAYKDGYEKGKEHATREGEQKYYAKIKGWELFVEFIGAQYWGEVSNYGRLGFVSIDDAKDRTKDEWERLGINEDNADFVKVEELEE